MTQVGEGRVAHAAEHTRFDHSRDLLDADGHAVPRFETEHRPYSLERNFVVTRVVGHRHILDLRVRYSAADDLDQIHLAVVLGRAPDVEYLVAHSLEGSAKHRHNRARRISHMDIRTPESFAEDHDTLVYQHLHHELVDRQVEPHPGRHTKQRRKAQHRSGQRGRRVVEQLVLDCDFRFRVQRQRAELVLLGCKNRGISHPAIIAARRREDEARHAGGLRRCDQPR